MKDKTNIGSLSRLSTRECEILKLVAWAIQCLVAGDDDVIEDT